MSILNRCFRYLVFAAAVTTGGLLVAGCATTSEPETLPDNMESLQTVRVIFKDCIKQAESLQQSIETLSVADAGTRDSAFSAYMSEIALLEKQAGVIRQLSREMNDNTEAYFRALAPRSPISSSVMDQFNSIGESTTILKNEYEQLFGVLNEMNEPSAITPSFARYIGKMTVRVKQAAQEGTERVDAFRKAVK